ncbi:hypothetical protein OF83DRAFT_1174536 [Amylostereum chailletii]|nr:hypothetical protein OF83DRAFT_1174536 [Amylostereum chailletii]
MGVHGLTTYIHENQRALSRPLRLPQPTSQPAIPLVVDGWSLIYELYGQSGLPRAFGGEYYEFGELVVQVARAWIDVGFKPYFVFDGPYPSLKLATGLSRATRSIVQPSLLFFRTSPTSRAAPRFMRENAILPPLCYTVTMHALKSLADSVEVHIADEEGDPYAVELAGRLHGYVTGRDSDFVVLNADGYAGYIPMDEMIWSTTAEDAPLDPDPSNDGFVVARKPTKKAKVNHRTGQGLLPPPTGTDLTLNCIVYSPLVLATHFRLPVSLLPLLGALVGNDFTTERRPVRRYFFEHEATPTQRITKVATTLASILPSTNGNVSKQRTKRPITNVVDLIEVAVETLLLRSSSALTTGERESIVEKTVEATLQYAIPNRRSDTSSSLWPSPACALHDANACPLVGLMSRPLVADPEQEEPLSRAALRKLYIAAYRRGQLSPRLMDVLSTGTGWPKLFLEDPDLECVTRSISRPIREWAYAILDDAIGLPARETAATEDTATTEDELEEDDDDELIDVVEEDSEEELEDSDPLAPLRGALQDLRIGSPSTASLPPSSYGPSRPKVIEEIIRRGSRAAGEDMIVSPLASLLASLPEPCPLNSSLPSLLQRTEAERFSLCLRILHSDTPTINSLTSAELGPVLALRWVVRCLYDRAAASGFNRDREKERWTHHEARAFLASFTPAAPSSDTELPIPELTNRNVQLVAQTLTTLDGIELLAQSLLLAERVPSPAPRFSGRRFHAALTSTSTPRDIPEHMWHACVTGIEECFGLERGKKAKKARSQAAPPTKRNASSQQSVFALLSGMDV